MSRTDQAVSAEEMVSAAIAGDEPAFTALAERHRRELHVHCYRMLASFDEAEDAVQETFLNAWRGRSGFEGGPQFRAWLYRIATNVCLDMLRRNSRRVTGGRSFAEVPWIQPYPDLLLDQAAPADEQPEAAAIARETISLAFLAAPVPGGGQPDAGRRELPAQAGRQPVPCVQARRHAPRGGPDRRDHDVRRRALPGLRAAGHAVSPAP
jgi:RNA polymerase sigma factor (sigma-70 family)